MGTFLTTGQVQDLIKVDRSTVYRMAEDGRLPGVKVGRQWRFPADRIATQFGVDIAGQSDQPPSDTGPSPSDLRRLLVPAAAEAIAGLLGDLFGVMAVITDMEGRPLTPVANQCGFYAAIAERPNAANACQEGWRRLAADPDMTPRFVPSHLGFLCARSFIRVGQQLVGMTVVGGIAPDEWPPPPEALRRIAEEVEISPEVLGELCDEIWKLDEAQQQRILGLLPRVADLISQVATARSQLLDKLDAIATLAGPVAIQEGTRS